jgi:divalent metal cation (Fe/Co/Zn/Cd) transporter
MQNKPQLLGYTEGLLSVGINVLLFGFKYWAGIKSDSVAMVADAWHTMSDTFTSLIILVSFLIAARPADEHHPFGHHRSDAIASGLIVIGALSGALSGAYLWWIDGVMGIAVSVLILYATYEILKGAVSSIIGEKPDPLIEERIKNLINNIAPAASCLHHVHIHRYGDHVELTLHCKLPYEMNLKEAHDLASVVEEAIRKEMNVEPTIHIEPQVETE